jgi:type I restriction enzyme R subunit
VLVAFSGKVIDGSDEWTEANMNRFPESQTAERFDSDDWQVLVVAEKYQTGFDQPLLYAMYVDKVLTGLAAVQTLSRLNRPCDGKDGTFVLDFRNEADDIRAAFEPWYGKTVAPPSDPNLLYDTRHALDEYGVLWPDEVAAAVGYLLAPEGGDTHGRFHGALTPTIDRFWALEPDDQDRFRDALNRFLRTYSFLSQIVAFTDVKLERDFLFCKALAAFVKSGGGGGLDLGSEVELTHLRIEQTFAGSVSLDAADGEVSTVFSGTGKRHETPEEALSQIIERLNERFGTSFAPENRVIYDLVADKLAARPDVQQAAAVNTPENFKLLLDTEFVSGMVEQLASSEDMVVKFLDNPDMQEEVLAAYLPFIQGKAKVLNQEHCPIADLLGPDRESQHLEYKATLRTQAVGGEEFKPLTTASLKTVAAFLNSREGGTLLIGVSDDGTVHGLASDYASLHRDGKGDRDVFQLHLADVVTASMGAAAAANISTQMHSIDGQDLCRVHVRPSGFPVDAKVTIVRKDQHEKKTNFYVRVANGTRSLDESEKQKYIATRWP